MGQGEAQNHSHAAAAPQRLNYRDLLLARHQRHLEQRAAEGERAIGLTEYRARRRDPATSHQAAARIKASGALGKQQQLVRDLVQRFPGHTSAELAMHLSVDRGQGPGGWAVLRPMVARRLPEIEPVHVRKGSARRCDVCGSESVTWWPR